MPAIIAHLSILWLCYYLGFNLLWIIPLSIIAVIVSAFFIGMIRTKSDREEKEMNEWNAKQRELRKQREYREVGKKF